jgi:tetratricopeptide (TPR) repeat protein
LSARFCYQESEVIYFAFLKVWEINKKAMLYRILCCLFLGLSTISYAQSPLTPVWEKLENKDNEGARKLLNKLINKKEFCTDATIALMTLNVVENRDKENLSLFSTAVDAMENPSPYVFAMWNTGGVQDGFDLSEKSQEAFFNGLIANPKMNYSVKNSVEYYMGIAEQMRLNYPKSLELWRNIRDLRKWQLTGPFDNSNGGGFDKRYAPQNQPKSDAQFKSMTEADIGWYMPKYANDQPYIATNNLFEEDQAVIYAQTFVDNSEARKIILAAGETGSLKVWVNDKLVITQKENLRTDMDLQTVSLNLPKGVSRILVQLGFTYKTNYPNFIVRLMDEKLKPLEGYTSSSEYQGYNSSESIGEVTEIPHFAEAFFQKKIKEEPKSLINYVLLGQTYYRSNKFNKAIDIQEEAQKMYPDNLFLEFYLMQCYSAIADRTRLVESIEKFRELDSDSYFFAIYDYNEAINNDNLPEAKQQLDKLKAFDGENSMTYLDYQIDYLGRMKEYVKLVDVVNKGYELYPDNGKFVELKSRVEKTFKGDKNAGVEVVLKHLKDHYNVALESSLIQEYQEMGNQEAAEELIFKRVEDYPYEREFVANAANFAFKLQDYDRALKLVNHILNNMPYYGKYWEEKGYILKALDRKQEAIFAFEKAISFSPNKFDAREIVRELKGQKPLDNFFKREDTYETIEKSLVAASPLDENYEYIFNEANQVVFEEGANVLYSRVAIKIINEAGIENWKEANIDRTSSQRLNILKAEVVKKGMKKIKAEQNGGKIVFPSLEIGDAIFIEYKIETYTGGKLRKEFWTDWSFNDYYPTKESTFRLIVPKDFKFYTEYRNFNLEPKKETKDDYDIYTWSVENPKKLEFENYMPSLSEVGQLVFISTVKDWQEIADWYQDLSLTQAEEGYNLDNIYEEIFAEEKATTEMEKAELIYKYISENIHYSSLPFRQNGYIPQKPMTTISTQLGDCKDLSVLYHTLARKAGLNTNLVLVNTRLNGENNMPLPTTDFDHCIIKINLSDEVIFQELTDSKLPFGYLPQTVKNAQGLVIPNTKEEQFGEELITIPARKSVKNTIQRKTTIKVGEEEMQLSSDVLVTGIGASDYRYYFTGLTNDELKERINSVTGSYFTNSVVVNDFAFENLGNQSNTLRLTTDFKLEGAIISIGGFRAISPAFFEGFMDKETFAEEDRAYDFLQWEYDQNDVYETEMTYELPEGMKWTEVPSDLSHEMSFFNYNLTVEKLSDTKMKIKRTVENKREKLSADDYKAFRKLVKKILKEEDFYLVFK